MSGAGCFALVGEVGGFCCGWACSCGRRGGALLIRWVGVVMLLGSGADANIEGGGTLVAVEGLSTGRLSSLRAGRSLASVLAWLWDSLPGWSSHRLWDGVP